MKITSAFLCSFVWIVLLSSCNQGEVNRLRAENDSLRQELNTRYAVVTTMREIRILIDSIDVSRNALHVDLHEGTSYDDFNKRMEGINEYVKQTEQKLDTIELALESSQFEATAYMMMVEALKGELHDRSAEIKKLHKQVETFRTENKGLQQTVKLQDTQLGDMRLKVEAKQRELALIEAKVSELVDNFKVTEAEAYFARAKAVEEAANRTRLAPNKKRETLREALELYKKALSLGKAEAKPLIDQLEKRVK